MVDGYFLYEGGNIRVISLFWLLTVAKQVHTYTLLTLYPRRGSRDISDILRHLYKLNFFTKNFFMKSSYSYPFPTLSEVGTTKIRQLFLLNIY
jgi:hypothetical protein